jgi:hypothetical protein
MCDSHSYNGRAASGPRSRQKCRQVRCPGPQPQATGRAVIDNTTFVMVVSLWLANRNDCPCKLVFWFRLPFK